jgi:hypothetical protein
MTHLLTDVSMRFTLFFGAFAGVAKKADAKVAAHERAYRIEYKRGDKISGSSENKRSKKSKPDVVQFDRHVQFTSTMQPNGSKKAYKAKPLTIMVRDLTSKIVAVETTLNLAELVKHQKVPERGFQVLAHDNHCVFNFMITGRAEAKAAGGCCGPAAVQQRGDDDGAAKPEGDAQPSDNGEAEAQLIIELREFLNTKRSELEGMEEQARHKKLVLREEAKWRLIVSACYPARQSEDNPNLTEAEVSRE